MNEKKSETDDRNEKYTAQIVVETPRGRRNKYKFDPSTGRMKLSKVMPEGMVFPYDFGFFPGTTAEDGDPLDVNYQRVRQIDLVCWVMPGRRRRGAYWRTRRPPSGSPSSPGGLNTPPLHSSATGRLCFG
jgi:hypothetical protein